VVTQTIRMAKKKPTANGEKRKPFKNARIPIVLAEVAMARADDLVEDFTHYVVAAVRMRLESEGRWPPRRKDDP
jgi:hypothetical protein